MTGIEAGWAWLIALESVQEGHRHTAILLPLSPPSGENR